MILNVIIGILPKKYCFNISFVFFISSSISTNMAHIDMTTVVYSHPLKC